MSGFLMEYRIELILLHVIGAVVWVGGMMSMRFAAHKGFMQIEDPKLRLSVLSSALERLFMLVLPFVILLAATGAILTIGYNVKASDFGYLARIKEGIWTVMFVNLVAMMIRRIKADKALIVEDYDRASKLLRTIGSVMVPINIALGLSAILLGVLLRINL